MNNRFENGQQRGTSREERLKPFEQVKTVREITEPDYTNILHWVSVSETRKHLDPPPARAILDWTNEADIKAGLQELSQYYQNKEEDPQKITPVVAINDRDESIGVLTIRWRGDPYVPKDRKIASIERFVVNPELQERGVGTQLMLAALEIIFSHYKGYVNGESAKEVRLWVMSDELAGDWQRNFSFFRRFGFEVMKGNWKEYAAKRGIATDRDALWLQLTREKWEKVKEEFKDTPHPAINPATLRI